ncbi:toluene hydroxylase, partial [Enterococcus hirae]
RHAQDIALYGMELEDVIEGFSDADCRAVWMESPEWQPLRRFLEELLAARDWAEINLAINLLYEPLAAALFARELVLRFAPHHGDSVTPVL